MSVQPGQHNITVQRRADYDLQLQFKDSAGVAINLTGWTVYAQVWDRARTTKYADFAVTYTDRLTGQVVIVLTDTQTATFPDEAFYDVLLENTAGIRNYYLEGIVYVSEGYTQPAP
jgi:hypothetical protein